MSEMPPPYDPVSAPPPPPSGGSYVPPPPAGGAASSDTLMLVLSYLGILALIPLIVKKDDREVQWHARNGLAIFIAYIILIVAWQIILHFLPSALSCGLSLVGCVLWIGYLVLIIMAIVKATKGERFRLPVVSEFADKM